MTGTELLITDGLDRAFAGTEGYPAMRWDPGGVSARRPQMPSGLRVGMNLRP